MPGHAYAPPATRCVHRVAHPGYHLPAAASRFPFGVKNTGAGHSTAALSWQPGVYWRSCGSVGPVSLSNAPRSPGHHDGVPASARDAVLHISRLRGPPSPHISISPTVHVAVPHRAKARGSANEASLAVRRL
ncbi:hypothetical protein MRX96_048029 [Rhipicephalus microplus]